jgi:hypothetical protein
MLFHFDTVSKLFLVPAKELLNTLSKTPFMQKVIVIFPSTYAAIKAERLCLESGIPCRVIPVPRDISSDCGVALEIDRAVKDRAEKAFIERAVDATFIDRSPT